MSKKLCAFRIDENLVELLKKLSEKYNRSQANMIEELIKEAAIKDKLLKR